jgi:hypothetical protein
MARIGYLSLLLLTLASSAAGQNVLTGSNDNYRTGANLAETILNPLTVKPGAFGRIFSLSVDGQIYAQPLYQQGVAIANNGGTHNVVFVATMHNSVYAFDADAPATPLWTVNLGLSVATSKYKSIQGPYTDITVENGILGTPVIDPATGTLYVVAATLTGSTYAYKLHALDTGSGAEKFGAPVTISPKVPGLGDNSSNGVVAFTASQQLQRPALLLSKGIVYAAFGSHGDEAPYHGWIVAYSSVNLASPLAVFNTSPNGTAGAIWQAGRGLPADPAGNVYAVTGNGDSDFSSSFGDSVVKLNSTTLSVADWFAPFNFAILDASDEDLGSCGPILIPGTNYMVAGGKQGMLYLLNTANMGHTAPNDTEIVQSLNTQGNSIFNMALWNRTDGPLLYLHLANSPVTGWKLTGSQFSTTPAAQSMNGFDVAFQGMALSANGTQPGSGILWVTGATTWPLPAPGVLHATAWPRSGTAP